MIHNPRVVIVMRRHSARTNPLAACSIPMTEFNHLTIAEVAEFERLEHEGARADWGSHRFDRQYARLIARRVCPDRNYRPPPPEAA